MKPKKSTDKHIKLVEKKHTEVVKEKYAGSFTGKKDKILVTLDTTKEKKPDQPNLFGEQDQVYNTIQEAISTATADIVSAQEAISKKEDQVAALMEWKQKLEKAALTVAKLRDSKLKLKSKKAVEEALKEKKE